MNCVLGALLFLSFNPNYFMKQKESETLRGWLWLIHIYIDNKQKGLHLNPDQSGSKSFLVSSILLH